MIIGVTGGIGSGKSTILRAVAGQGYAVYDCDVQAKRIIMEDPAVRKQMTALFGEGVYADGVYQTSYVAAQVFVYPEKLQQLNAIVHPAVMEDIRSQMSDVRSQMSDTLFVESAILVSSGIAELCDAVVTITAPEDVRVERVLKRAEQQGKPTTADEVRARIRSQKSEFRSQDSGFRNQKSVEICNDGKRSIEDLAQELIFFAQKLANIKKKS